MQRRDLLKLIAAATGVAVVGTKTLSYEALPTINLADTGFSAADVALFNEIAEVIIPATDSPGAKAANVGAVIAVLAADCYTPALQRAFRAGIGQLQDQCQQRYQRHFLQLNTQERLNLLQQLDAQAKDANRSNNINYDELQSASQYNIDDTHPIPHYFTLLKQLSLLGFFTSQQGATQALRYVAIPGRYDGEYPYKKGDKAWAT